MRFTHPEHPGRCVRLAYCLNVHAAETLEDLHAGLRTITLPLRDRLVTPGESFGVGMYFSAALAEELQRSEAALGDLRQLLAREALDPFTYNAFPYGGFHAASVKHKVYHPPWGSDERLAYTLLVAELGCALAGAGRRLSISTHAGGWGAELAHGDRAERALEGLEDARDFLHALAARGGGQIALGIEAEPRSNANATADAAAIARRAGVSLCLDACHSAVEFEDPRAALDAALGAGPLAKFQYTNALALLAPGKNAAGWRALLALDEPRYLHQVTARSADGLRRFDDLGPLKEHDAAQFDELRCHFHVPVDREELGSGLVTTRAHAEALLDGLLEAPGRWGSDELHVEIETYTWDVLPGAARGPGSLVEGLEREYRHVIGRLEAKGWTRGG
ncbi:MAG: metabolite traffic protein EboE [Planctomycetes bacterium]|nr:metabolite traffic protein EboE [Planctomycetota bacterium]